MTLRLNDLERTEAEPKGLPDETRLRWRMRDFAQKLTYAKGVLACGRFVSDRRTGGVVRLCWARETNRTYYSGLLRCNSPWECPVCVERLQRARAEELRAFGKQHRSAGGAVWHAVFTLAHNDGDFLKATRTLVAKAWSSLVRGSPWKRWVERLGIIGDVRALECTHGWENGWHPHIHVALYLRRRPQASVAEPNVSHVRAGARDMVRFREWLREAWTARIVRGGHRKPARLFRTSHGRALELLDVAVRLSEAKSDDYIAKMGLARELVSSATKEGRAGHRTYLQILRDLTLYRRAEDFPLWKEWIRAMRGAKQLTYSPGFRNWQAIYGLHVFNEADDSQGELELPNPNEDDEVVYTFDAADWHQIISSPRSTCLRLLLLEVPLLYPREEWRDLIILLVRRASWWRPIYPERARAA